MATRKSSDATDSRSIPLVEAPAPRVGESVAPDFSRERRVAKDKSAAKAHKISIASSRDGFAVVSLSVAIGVLGTALLTKTVWGAGATVWSLIFVLALIGVTTDWTARIHRSRLWIAIPLLLTPFAFLWHAAGELLAANTAALVTLAGVWVATLRDDEQVSLDGIPFARTIGKLAAVFPRYAGAQIDWTHFSKPERAPAVRSVFRGLALATPVLLLFGVLLASADDRFAELISFPFLADYGEAIEYVAYSLVFTWFSGMLIMGCAAGFRQNRIAEPKAPRFQIDRVEASVILGSVSVLFVAFIATQFTSLLVPATVGSEIAANARSGFFDLTAVAAISLVLVTSLRKRLRCEDPKQRKTFAGYAAANAGLVLLILGSAAMRMADYTAAFGWTELRLNTSFAMAWTALVFCALIVSVLGYSKLSLAKFGIVSAYILFGLLHILNPHAFIAAKNIERGGNESWDTYYLSTLSADAVPTIMSHWNELSSEAQVQLSREWVSRFGAGPQILETPELRSNYARRSRHSGDWRAWNISREKAHQIALLPPIRSSAGGTGTK